jgi:hypothetical protein
MTSLSQILTRNSLAINNSIHDKFRILRYKICSYFIYIESFPNFVYGNTRIPAGQSPETPLLRQTRLSLMRLIPDTGLAL